jgi:hypothetical protein
MTVIVERRRSLLRTGHAFFEYPEGPLAYDIVRAIQVPEPRSGDGWVCTEFYTLLLDLRLEEDVLWQAIKNGCRQEIRRARDRDGLAVDVFDAPRQSELDAFLPFYDASAQVKGIGTGDRGMLESLGREGALGLGRVATADGQALAWHAYVVASGRARLLQSAIRREPAAADSRAATGRANRLLHWKEICHFRERGLQTYDFGGLAMTGEDPALAGIDAFKRAFGGAVVREFKCRRANSALGRLALIVERQSARWRARSGAAAGG